MATTVDRRAGADEPPLRVHPPAPADRQTRVSWIVIGVLLVAGCAVGIAVWANRIADRQPVAALARPVARGQVLTAADLTVARVAVDPGVPTIPSGRRQQLVGRSAVADLPAGTLLTDALVTDTPALAPDQQIVGLALEPGQYPLAQLARGDQVAVVRTGPPDGVGGGQSAVLAGDAAVFAVQPLGDTTLTLLVSVVVDDTAAAPIAAAAADDKVRITLVGAP